MTVETSDTIERAIISGVGPYTFNFRIFDEDDLLVQVDVGDEDTVELSINSHYTVTGVDDEDGGTVTLTSGVATQFAGDTLDIRSNTTEYQPTSIRNQGAFLPEIHEDAFDRLSRQVQDLSRKVDASVRYPDDETTSAAAPKVTSRRGRYLFSNAVTGLFEWVTSIATTALSQTIFNQYQTDSNSYKRTAAEIAGGVTPTDYSVPNHEANGFFDLARYGITGTASDIAAPLQIIINMVNTAGGGTILARKASTSYNLGTTGITLPARVKILGVNEDASQFLYSGTGVAIDCSGSTNALENIYLVVTTASGSGLRFGNVSRRAILKQVTVQCNYSPGADRLGAGLVLRTLTTDTAFSGDFMMESFYSLGFKFGIQFDCFEVAEKTWTSVVGSKIFLVGPGAGVCAGSIGIWTDSTTNGIGSSIFGGTIEGYEVPIQVDLGEGYGINYYGDIEGNTVNDPSLAASYSGEVVAHNSGKFYRAGANGSTNRWMRERHLNGTWIREVYVNHEFVLYNNGGNTAFFDIYRGDSKIDGSSPTRKFRVATGNSNADSAGERNYLEFNGSRMSWGASASPSSGTWARGDVWWNTGVSAGGSPGSVCTTAGSPGTWKAMANVAA